MLLTVLFLFVTAGSFIIGAKPVYAGEDDARTITVVYFYYDYCSQCNEARKIITGLAGDLKSKDAGLKLTTVMHDALKTEEYRLLQRYFQEYSVPEEKQSVPVAFIGDRYYTGAEKISKGLLEQAAREDLPETPIIKAGLETDTALARFSAMKAVNVFLIGLANGFNPCSLSMLLLLLSMLLVKKTSIRKMGLAFAASKFITYLLLGTVLFNLFSILKLQWFGILTKAVLLAFTVFIAGLNLRDYFYARAEKYDGIKMQLPRGLRKLNHEWINRAMANEGAGTILLMCIILGVLISVGEFLCTGQMYLGTILYVLHGGETFSLRAVMYLIIYDVAFILPVIAITLIIHKGRNVFDISELVRRRLPLIKLVNAFVFLVFGLLRRCCFSGILLRMVMWNCLRLLRRF